MCAQSLNLMSRDRFCIPSRADSDERKTINSNCSSTSQLSDFEAQPPQTQTVSFQESSNPASAISMDFPGSPVHPAVCQVPSDKKRPQGKPFISALSPQKSRQNPPTRKDISRNSSKKEISNDSTKDTTPRSSFLSKLRTVLGERPSRVQIQSSDRALTLPSSGDVWEIASQAFSDTSDTLPSVHLQPNHSGHRCSPPPLASVERPSHDLLKSSNPDAKPYQMKTSAFEFLSVIHFPASPIELPSVTLPINRATETVEPSQSLGNSVGLLQTLQPVEVATSKRRPPPPPAPPLPRGILLHNRYAKQRLTAPGNLDRSLLQAGATVTAKRVRFCDANSIHVVERLAAEAYEVPVLASPRTGRRNSASTYGEYQRNEQVFIDSASNSLVALVGSEECCASLEDFL